MFDNQLLLMSGNDIPFTSGMGIIHQPKIKEIGFIGEEEFHIGSRFLLFDKNSLILEDKSVLENKSNFNIFMSVMNSKESAKHKTDAIKVLTLLFPNSEIKIEQDKILFQQENINIEANITEWNFEEFQDIIRKMFCLDNAENGGKTYNPADALAERLAKKFDRRKQLLAKKHGQENKKVNIFSQYISILSVGLQKDMNELLNYTVYQLFDEFQRYQAKQNFDMYVQAKMAGASDLEEVKNWMEELHS